MIKIVEKNSIVPIDTVQANSFNPKDIKTDSLYFRDTIQSLKKSLKAHGQIQAIRVRELKKSTFEIIDGYHTWYALKEIGATEIEIKNLGKLSDLQAKTILLTLEDIKNPLDAEKEAQLLYNLSKEAGLTIDQISEITPYDPTELESKFEVINFDWQSESEKPHLVLNIDFDTEEDKLNFKEFMTTERKSKKITEGEFLLSLIKKI